MSRGQRQGVKRGTSQDSGCHDLQGLPQCLHVQRHLSVSHSVLTASGSPLSFLLSMKACISLATQQWVNWSAASPQILGKVLSVSQVCSEGPNVPCPGLAFE